MRKRKTYLRMILYVLAGLILVQAAFILLVFGGAFGKIPDMQTLKGIQNPVASEIYTADGVLMGNYYIQNRQKLESGQISDTLRNALIATEDIRYYAHHGIDIRSLGRVFFKTLLMGKESSGGGSTLTQQLAKNLYPRRDYKFLNTSVNKLREMATALRMEKVYTKEEILELYLSTVPFGESTFGIQSASILYFNTAPGALKVEETALLVGMLKATGNYNPVRNPSNAQARRNVVLGQMARYNFIDTATADSLKFLPLHLQYNPLPHNAGIAPYFREFLRGELDRWCLGHFKDQSTHYNLYTDGLKIYTTLDSRLQQYAEEAVRQHMAYLQDVFERQWKNKELWRGINEQQLLINYDGNYRKDMNLEAPGKMEVFTWKGMQERELNTIDSIKHYLQFLQAGFLAMDASTGELKAWVGGINHHYFKYDHVLARRQAGSAFKPLVYLAALEKGIAPCDYFPNDSVVYHEYDDWTPRNADRKYGGYYSMKGALVHSVNTVSVKLLMETGIDTVIALGQKAGIVSSLPAVPSLALGTGNVSLLEMVGFYQAIANRGVSRKPIYISRIENKDGEVLFEQDPGEETGTIICQPENAELMIEMLREVVNRGTAMGLRSKDQITSDIAGKTGTTQNYTDGWFIGFTPDLVAGVWVGGDLQNLRFRSMEYGQGARSAMPIWAGFMKSAFQDEHWSSLQYGEFDISESTRYEMACDDFREKRPFMFKPLKVLKGSKFLKRLFKRRRK